MKLNDLNFSIIKVKNFYFFKYITKGVQSRPRLNEKKIDNFHCYVRTQDGFRTTAQNLRNFKAVRG